MCTKNLSISQQKEFEKLMNKINILQNQLLEQETSHRKDMDRMQNIQNNLSNEYMGMKSIAKHYKEYNKMLKINLVKTINKLNLVNPYIKEGVTNYDDEVDLNDTETYDDWSKAYEDYKID